MTNFGIRDRRISSVIGGFSLLAGPLERDSTVIILIAITRSIFAYYFFRYDSLPFSETICNLVQILINTVDNQNHRCQIQTDELTSPVLSRTRGGLCVQCADLFVSMHVCIVYCVVER